MPKRKIRRTKYIKGLNNSYWEKVKHKIKLRDNFVCQISGKRIDLSVHHISYHIMKNGVRIDIRGRELEFLEWLILLNQDIHENIVHANNAHALNPKNPERIDAIKFKELNYKD